MAGQGGEFADNMNDMPKFVASATLQDLEWNNSTLLDGDVGEVVAELKQDDGGPISSPAAARWCTR